MAAVVVAVVSSQLGTRWSDAELQRRSDAIKEALADATYPLNATVLNSLANLTQTEMVTFDGLAKVRHSTFPLNHPRVAGPQLVRATEPAANAKRLIEIEDVSYRVRHFETVRPMMRGDGVFTVAVLFDQQQIDANRRRAMLLPLATGLSTILALTTITLVLGSRLVGRLDRLKLRVKAVADGDFTSNVSDNVADEVGQLGDAVDHMAKQLDRLWSEVNRQQSQKLLHQIAGGMAHQLRNSLTGARMAVELHAQGCETTDRESLNVAIHQIEVSEDYVRRLLVVASGRQDEDRPQDAQQCIADVRSSLTPIARHLKIDLHWNISEAVKELTLLDGSTWVAAVTNLIHNAMQAGDQVRITFKTTDDCGLLVSVSDNGEGVPDLIADALFDPFVTMKPEGMGLGLSVVRRAAEHLGGEANWRRENDWTIFELRTAARRRTDSHE